MGRSRGIFFIRGGGGGGSNHLLRDICIKSFSICFPFAGTYSIPLWIHLDSFQGCYKDGTELGTRDYRWFSAVYLALRCFAIVVYSISTDGIYVL